MPMASDQRRKRLNGASMVSYGSPEQYRTKRKNFGLVPSDITMKSHISVEWDGNHQKVIAKREQIGISWRQMRPFTNFVHDGHKVLADVLSIPPEIFSLDSLNDVLSYEVWNTQLLDNERNLLMQFLPSSAFESQRLPSALEPHKVVRELLSGDNFHFGNPFVKWGASLCAGDLHPDMIVNQEQHLKSEKRAYYSQLHNYHMDMIGYLTQLKEEWESCKDPEKEILPKIQRSRNDIEKRRLSNLNGFRVDLDRNMTLTSDSSSWGAEDKAYSDNQISSLGQGNELQRRVLGTNFNKPRNLMVSSDVRLNVGARPKKGGKVNKLNIHTSDGDKYMSYIKVSKRQHELVKSLKLSCKSIQASTLDHILGGIDNIHVQPYGLFIKEEQKKLCEHWLQLVNNDLPAAYANWTERLTLTHKMRKSLLLDIKEKSNVLVEGEDIVSPQAQAQAQAQEDGGVNIQSSSEEEEDSIDTLPEDLPLHNSYHSDNDELHHLSIDSEKNHLSIGDDASWSKAEHSRIMNSQDDPIGEGAPFSSDGHTWQAVETSHSYYDSAVTHEYTAKGISLVNPQASEDKHTQIFGPESDLQREGTVKELIHRQSDDGQFGSYQSENQIDFIQSLIKGKGVNSYHHEQNIAGLNFQASNNVPMGSGQFSSHFKEPVLTSLTLDQGQRQTSEVYVPEGISGSSIYSHEGRCLMPGQDPLSAGNITDWTVNAPRAVAPSQSHVNTGDFIGRHWFSSDHRVQGAWNGSNNGSVSNQRLGTGGNSDQSLFTVLSQCSQLGSGSPYESVRHTDQFIAPRTYGVVDASSHRINGIVPASSHPVDYFSGCDAPSALVPDDMTWASLPPQNAALNDQIEKSYKRPWDQ